MAASSDYDFGTVQINAMIRAIEELNVDLQKPGETLANSVNRCEQQIKKEFLKNFITKLVDSLI